MITLWLPDRSPHLGRALVPAPLALARYSAAAADLSCGVARAHDAACQREQEHHDQDSTDSAHTSPMAGLTGSDHTGRTNCVNGGRS